MLSSFMATAGLAQPQPPNYNDGVFLNFSQDGGETWRMDTFPAFGHARSPDIVTLRDGRIFICFADYAGFNPENGQSLENAPLSYSILEPRSSWSERTELVIEGAEAQKPMSPSVVQLPSGRLRLYYYDRIESRSTGQTHSIYSAISLPGDPLRFKREEGKRFSAYGITDPEVIKMEDGTWRMYVANSVQEVIMVANSANGMDFFDTGSIVYGQGIPGALAIEGGAVRLFINDVENIISFISYDGLNFQDEDWVHIQPIPNRSLVTDPSLAVDFSGLLMMAVTRLPDPGLVWE